MYTEENEFDYNEYLNETSDYNSNDYSSNKKTFNKGFIIKVLLIVLCLILVIFLVFKIRNNNRNNDNNDNQNNSLLVFNNNVAILKDAAETYFFDQENMPKEQGEELIISVSDLMDKKLINEIKDYDGYSCGYNTSYVSMKKNKNDYMLKIYLLCPSIEDSVVYYYDLEGKCLNCNGENYVSNDDSDLENNNDKEEIVISCKDFSEWKTDYIEDPTLERESRVLVIGYKDNITYGEYSNPTETPITASEVLDVKVEEKEEVVKKASDWVTGLTKKPKEKEGRVIKKYTKKSSYTTYKTETETYTKTLSMRDPNATSCKTTGIGKVECTYTKTVEVPVKNYSTKTYYKYQDTTEEIVKKTYYSAREIFKGETEYTDYILESEMPEGYQKVPGSEVIQYRYREVCTK